MDIAELWNALTFTIAAALYVATLVFVLHVVLSRKPAAASWAWILGIVFIPYLGALGYLLFGHDRIARPHLRRRRRTLDLFRMRMRPLPASEPGTRGGGALARDSVDDLDRLLGPDLPATSIERLREAMKLAGRAPTTANEVELLPDGDSTFAALLEAIAQARDHVHIEYYVFRPDGTGQAFVDALAAAAARGVEIRLLLDAVGTWHTPREFFQPLVDAGGRLEYFMPVRFLVTPTRTHLRNHRKVAIVDGTTAFTGGVNIGDEYRGGEGRPFRVWADVFIRLRGPAALDLQQVFAEDWITATGEDLSTVERYFPVPSRAGASVVQIIDSGPDEDIQQVHEILFAGVLGARRQAWLTTPYFIPTEALLEALKLAARRGVDVRLLFPSRLTNHPLVFHAGRWYYHELLEAGVRIFEFQQGIVHAKLATFDGEYASIGSANMDIRSFRLNFELNALIFSTHFTAALDRYFHDRVVESHEITQRDLDARRISQRLLEGFCRLLSPVL